MNTVEPSTPSLVEPGAKYFLRETLKNCNIYREKYKNHMFNVGMLVAFGVVVALILLYKYKGRLTDHEMAAKDREKKQYILSKIKNFQDAKRLSQQQLITGLPHWDNEYDAISGDIGKLGKII